MPSPCLLSPCLLSVSLSVCLEQEEERDPLPVSAACHRPLSITVWLSGLYPEDGNAGRSG